MQRKEWSILVCISEKKLLKLSQNLQNDFKFPPIVTATALNIGNTEAGQNVTVVLQKPTTSKVDGFVRFGASGNLSLAVNLIAVGIPN